MLAVKHSIKKQSNTCFSLLFVVKHKHTEKSNNNYNYELGEPILRTNWNTALSLPIDCVFFFSFNYFWLIVSDFPFLNNYICN